MKKAPKWKTAQKLSDDLIEAKWLFKVIFNHSHLAFVVTDSQERVIALNPMAEKMLGSLKGVFNKPLSCLFTESEWKRIDLLRRRHQGTLTNVMTSILGKKSQDVDVSASLSCFKNSQGNVKGSVAIFYDMTDIKHTQEALLAAKIAAEEANKAKSVFLAKMSHEVRSPMNAIIGMLDLTLETPLNDEQKDNINVAKDAADSLLSLINDILDLSRAQADKIALEEIEINVPEIIKNVCKGLMVLARNKGVDVLWSCDTQIPRALIGDPVRVRQVLVNLVNNSIKFTHKGKVEVSARMKSLTDKTCEVVFEVKDSGIGIPAKNVPHIFDVFTDAHNATARRYGGTGLGLAICKKIVEMMHGAIEVESTEGEGSVFRFNLIFKFDPKLLEQEKDTEKQNEEGHAAKLPAELQHLRILLAEDNTVSQRIAMRLLEKIGWKVTVANNGQELLDILNKQTFDVILTDDLMPMLNGVEAAQVIRREEKQTGLHVPIIVMTANAMTGDREKYLEAGMDGYVSKPIDRNLLFQEIVTHVSKRFKN
ncbi:MAG: response regulator [Candidatus Omnitrophica bacterium]|nr:response regulator [Candidatus Omnitrophota bacterium]